MHLGEQALDCPEGQFPYAAVYGGERGNRVAALFDIIETYHRYVLRNPEPELVGGTEAPDGDIVVESDNRGRQFVDTGQQFLCDLVGGIGFPIATDNIRGGYPVLEERIGAADHAFAGGKVGADSGYQGELPVSQLHQMIAHVDHAGHVVGQVRKDARIVFVHQHAGDFGLQSHLDEFVGGIADKDDPVEVLPFQHILEVIVLIERGVEASIPLGPRFLFGVVEEGGVERLADTVGAVDGWRKEKTDRAMGFLSGLQRPGILREHGCTSIAYHLGSDTRKLDHEAVVDQHLQCLAHRRTVDTVLFADLAFGWKQFAVLVGAGENPGLYGVIDLFIQQFGVGHYGSLLSENYRVIHYNARLNICWYTFASTGRGLHVMWPVVRLTVSSMCSISGSAPFR